MNKIDKLIINSPYSEPTHYWSYDRETRSFSLAEGRRPAGYVIASETSKSFDDPGVFKEIQLVNLIRPRIKKWREAGYPGICGITKDYLIKLKYDSYLIVEVKGQEDQQDKVKWDYLAEWVQAVNEYSGFGKWKWDVVDEPQKILEILV